MTPDTAAQQPLATADTLADIHKRLVRVHAALAERTDREVHEIMPWTLEELMTTTRAVRTLQRQLPNDAGSHPSPI